MPGSARAQLLAHELWAAIVNDQPDRVARIALSDRSAGEAQLGARKTSALMIAAEANRSECVRVLLSFSRLEALNSAGQNAAMVAALAGSYNALCLLAPSSDLTRQDHAGCNVLHLAALGGCALCLELGSRLPEAARLARELDQQGRSPLMIAAERGAELTRALLPLSDLLTPSADGRSRVGDLALQIAQLAGRVESATLLERALLAQAIAPAPALGALPARI